MESKILERIKHKKHQQEKSDSIKDFYNYQGKKFHYHL